VAIVGTGVSLSLTDGKTPALAWRGLVEDGFAYAGTKGCLTPAQAVAWKPHLESPDIDDLLSAAEFMGRKLNAPEGDLYARWLEAAVGNVKVTSQPMTRAILALRERGVPLCTLNYDTLLEQVTGLPSITLAEPAKVGSWVRGELPAILHLHGSWETPKSCVLGIRDYETTLHDQVRDLVQRSLASFKRLLFIGCGDTFLDPNFASLVRWLRGKMRAAAPEHYALVTSSESAKRHADPAWHGFVEPLPYGDHHAELAGFLLKNFRPPAPKEKASTLRPSLNAERNLGDKAIRNYRQFLVRDCGQMTIEGVRADLDTAQRRFDLERLYVPLNVSPSPPAFALSDPDRDRKLQAWLEEHKNPLPFATAFARHKRLALLALPGGGKTLLLKRLAVAYADPDRRQEASDSLPDLKLSPVLIRCREWREHIHKPIPKLLDSISDITGDGSLAGLSTGLAPLLSQGKLLLLVDGLDEIHDDAARSVFVDNLEKFLDTYPKIHLVVTSREAGFSLVAPSIARFCEQWRIASLDEAAIRLLCDHWHRLMTGDAPEALTESGEVATLVLNNPAVRRLAENPLLLTMLLVVKHGAGRLPPDRVSLYGRAVEVLLDTWNIKGHEPLNPKEAVPQLAFLALQLMKAGQQTATERELLRLLDEARENVPQIRRYASDRPHEFLKRVELRSSLLVEAGHQIENGQAVPFYQFRHLTFQEYLAAVAAVEGHYINYKPSDTALTPIEPHLLLDEWKEVVPMSAVLARKQAEPLMAALVREARIVQRRVAATGFFPRDAARTGHGLSPIPSAAGRLTQCLVEEAEAAPDTLISALQLVVFFARGCRWGGDWRALVRGPYGKELLHQASLMYEPMDWPHETWLLNTYGSLLEMQRSTAYWCSAEGQSEWVGLIDDDDPRNICRGLLICMGLIWNTGARRREDGVIETCRSQIPRIESRLFHSHSGVWAAAIWLWAYMHAGESDGAVASPRVRDRLLDLWRSSQLGRERVSYALVIALEESLGGERLQLVDGLRQAIVEVLEARPSSGDERGKEAHRSIYAAAVMMAFLSRDVCSDEELARHLVVARTRVRDVVGWPPGFRSRKIDEMIRVLTGKARKARSSRRGERRHSGHRLD